MPDRKKGVTGLSCAIVLAALLGLAGLADAASLKVAPGRFIIHDVKPGVEYDLYKETGLRITIYNDDDASRMWRLSVHRPSERGKWERGYGEIPDARWCWLDRSEVTVEPKGRAYANVFLKIPDDPKYSNQHWVATIGVDGKPGAGGIALAADIRIQIETASDADPAQRPAGSLAVAPSIVAFENVAPGSVEKARTVLFNHESHARTVHVAPLFDDVNVDPAVYLTHGHERLPDSAWLAFPGTVEIPAGGEAVMEITLNVPNDPAHFGKKWESVLLLESGEGPLNMVRVRVVTKKTE
ncbi:MAG TPA: hypothetical protein P5318_07140 [Candidatus Hydrogenedentes bacterium]|nr:hypothetical protein [Candidatus Hydrogenedentota bacterium]HRT19890.1 hypothetical protein [Candidatus Hydrogenedentota bacterium]HRT65470.1 hypothetical protein [Candidatus Hydrogenedentota bacterium]